jgi:hypothetical protein
LNAGRLLGTSSYRLEAMIFALGSENLFSILRGRWRAATPRLPVPFACAIVVLLAAAPFLSVVNNGFVSFDDPSYIVENAHVNIGLAWDNVVWAFTRSHMGMWHPVTWISHMVDCDLFGLDPGGHHLMGVAIHAMNAVLLLLVLRAMTGSLWRSALVAALFAVHPLRVESVAWASERKDLLSGTFWMLTLLLYAAYARRPSARVFSLVVISFALGLMAKPILVTLPFVMLLLDVWPLRRLNAAGSDPTTTGHETFSLRELLAEKLPLLVLVAASCLVAILSQAADRAITSEHVMPMAVRLANIPISYASYILQSVWPVDLAFFYPSPTHVDGMLIGKAVGSLILLAGVTTWVLLPRVRATRPHLAVGWLWYLGTLVPVIGIIQVGEQAMADRYTYLPTIGIALALAWELGRLVQSSRAQASVVAAACLFGLAGLGAGTHRQVDRWRDGFTLYAHALEVTSGNYIAHSLLGAEYLEREEYDAATEQFLEALRIEPRMHQVHYNLGIVHIMRHEWAKAAARFRETLKHNPDNSEAHNNLGILLEQEGRLDEAIAHYRKAVESMPENLDAQSNLRDASAVRNRERGTAPR